MSRTMIYANRNSPIELFLSSMLFGILSALVVAALLIMCNKTASHISKRVLLPSIVLLYASTSVYMGALVWSAIAGRIPSDTQSFEDDAQSGYEHDARVQSWMVSITLPMNIMVGDFVVWWRACMVWPKKLLYLVGAMVIVANFVLTIVALCVSSRHTRTLSFLYSRSKYARASAILCIAMNVIATALIAYKAWTHKRFLRKYVGNGVIYSALIAFVAIYEEGPLSYRTDGEQAFAGVASEITYGCLMPLIAMYPTIIVVVSHYRFPPEGVRHAQADDSDSSGGDDRSADACQPLMSDVITVKTNRLAIEALRRERSMCSTVDSRQALISKQEQKVVELAQSSVELPQTAHFGFECIGFRSI